MRASDGAQAFDIDFSGKTALVTGAAHGIGLAIAQQLRSCGARVLGLDKDGEALAAAFPEAADRIVSDAAAEDPVGLGSRIVAEHGPIPLLVNNVGVTTPNAFLELDPDDFDLVFNTNLRTPWFLTRQLVRALVAAEAGGAILFFSSVHEAALRLNPHYSASKAAVALLVKELAHELAPHRIRVNSVAPGWIRTEDRPDPEHERELVRLIPAGRGGEPEDVARVAAILLSDEACGYVTGASVTIDGGLSLHSWVMDL
jgi:3-oxoacyl-[acyl-carrier protein] reductase